MERRGPQSFKTECPVDWNTITASVSFDVCSLLIMPGKHFLEITCVRRGLYHADFTALGSHGALRHPGGAVHSCLQVVEKCFYSDICFIFFFLLLYVLNNIILDYVQRVSNRFLFCFMYYICDFKK